jgi:hypothetical protein
MRNSHRREVNVEHSRPEPHNEVAGAAAAIEEHSRL